MGESQQNQLQRTRADGDLTVTALYTAQAAVWGGFDGAALFDTPQARGVFRATNLVLWLVGLFRRDVISLRHTVVQRHAMIDHLVRSSGAREVVELAAGLSRRGASFSADPALRYVEVDLPGVIARKERLLERTEAGRAVAKRPNLVRVGADVRDVDLGALATTSGPVCVVAEGLLMYFDAESQHALWRRVADLLASRPGSVFLFDLVPAVEEPAPGLAGRVLGWLMRAFTRGRGFARDERTREDVRGELLGCGFAAVEVLEPADLAADTQIPALECRTRVVLYHCQGP